MNDINMIHKRKFKLYKQYDHDVDLLETDDISEGINPPGIMMKSMVMQIL